MITTANTQPIVANATIASNLFFWLKPLSDAPTLPVLSPERWSDPIVQEVELDRWKEVSDTIGAVYRSHFEGYTDSGDTLLDLLSSMEIEIKTLIQSTTLQDDRYQPAIGHMEKAQEIISAELQKIDDRWITSGYLDNLKSISAPTSGDDFKIKLSKALFSIEFYVINIRDSLMNGVEAINRAMPNQSQHSTEGQNVSDKASTVSPSLGFDSYLKVEYRCLIPFLKQHCTNKRPRIYMPMLFALEGYMETRLDKIEQKELHIALVNTFGNIGIYGALNNAMQLYSNEKNPDPARQQKIKNCKKQIDDEIERLRQVPVH